MNPFLKWPGGKRWFVGNHMSHVPATFNRYIEPFLGAGALFFHLKPKEALLSDTNGQLINSYLAIKSNWKLLLKYLKLHSKSHSKNYYYKIRSVVPTSSISSASRFIYLNRTCFNGIYRVNKKGEFNVPIGDRSNIIISEAELQQLSNIISKAQLTKCDFETSIRRARKDDLVFADPPYTACHNVNGFRKYNEVIFSWKDQIRLANLLADARDNGVKVLSTNANHQDIVQLYSRLNFQVTPISRFSSVSAKSRNRGIFKEVLISSHDY